jgi:hypothetical protein
MKNETLERRIKIHQQLLGTRLIARPVAENCWSFLIIKKLCLNHFWQPCLLSLLLNKFLICFLNDELFIY